MTQMINKNSLTLILALFFALFAQAQTVFEGTTTWHNQAHGGWKIEPQNNQGYVIIGNRYFSNPNTKSTIPDLTSSATLPPPKHTKLTLPTCQLFGKTSVQVLFR